MLEIFVACYALNREIRAVYMIRLLLLLSFFPVRGQIVNPMPIELVLTGSFCELRSNHYHTGLDFRTQQRTGIPVLSVEQGYVSRVGWSAEGYGRVLYVTHPKLGLTSVYAHLESFSAGIEAYVDSLLMAECAFELDRELPKGLLSVARGEEIGKSGNTGSSTGPHLHFELRNSQTERALNPLDFGLKIADTRPPFFKQIGMVRRMESGLDSLWVLQKVSSGNGYRPSYLGNAKAYPAGHWSVVFEAEDRVNGSGFRTDLRRIRLLVDDSLVFEWKVDSIDFEDSRYINAHLMYKQSLKGLRLRRTYRLANDRAGYWQVLPLAGWAEVNSKNRSFRLEIEDDAGNKTRTDWEFAAKAEAPRQKATLFVLPETPLVLTSDGISLQVHPELLYGPQPFNLQKLPAPGPCGLPQWNIGDAGFPVHSEYVFAVDSNFFGEAKKLQLQGLINYKGRFYPAKDTWVEGGKIMVRTNDQGVFSFCEDRVAPRVEILKAAYPRLEFKVIEEGKGMDRLSVRLNGRCLPWRLEKAGRFWVDVPKDIEAPFTLCVEGGDKAGHRFSISRPVFE